MFSEKYHHHSSSPKRFFKGVKSFLRGRSSSSSSNSSKDSDQQQDSFSKDGIAVTLTAEIHTKLHTGPITLLHPNFSFLPTRSISLFQQEKAYVHYEPKRAQITLGTSPDTKVFHLTVEQYATLIQQLQEEQHSLFPDSLFHSPMLGIVLTHPTTKSIGKRLVRFVQQQRRRRQRRTSSDELIVAATHRQCIFILPKALLLQAAAYIPLPQDTIHDHALSQVPYETITDAYYLQLKRYCRSLSLGTHELLVTQQLKQEPSPPSSFVYNNNNNAKSDGGELTSIRCADCPVTTGLQTLVQRTKQQTQGKAIGSSTAATRRLFPFPPPHHASASLQNNSESILFPISYAHHNTTALMHAASTHRNNTALKLQKENETDFMSSAILPGRRVLFDSIAKKQKLRTSSAFQYMPPDNRLTTMASSGHSSSNSSELSDIELEKQADADDDDDDDDQDDDYQDEDEGIVQQDSEAKEFRCEAPKKYGYVAVDAENEEILVVFPGMSSSSLSHAMFENASFAAVPWLEIETITSQPPLHKRKLYEAEEEEEDELPWVLECALTAWHRCEVRVVTLLMRLCGALPSHYKVVIVGHSLGGAVAALCASSLRSTQLLMNRSITVCAIHPPRVGNKSFLKTLSYQRVDTIRITDDRDVMAHLPPRTSGLLHLGDSTVILPTTQGDGSKGHSLQDMTSIQIEDTLNKTFEFKDYAMQAHFKAWDVCLDDGENSCI